MSVRSYIFILLLLIVPAVCHAGEALRVGDGKIISAEGLIDEIVRADFVFVGEQHVVEQHHRIQLDVIKALKVAGSTVAVGLEMFRAEEQPILDAWVEGRLPIDIFISAFEDNWGFPWPLYEEIFLYARAEGIPLVGLNLPRDVTKKVAEGGFESLSAEDLKKLPPGISCDLDEGYMKYIKDVYGKHNGRNRSFEHFCEAQLIWDKVMALRLIEYLRKNKGALVVVLAGGSHAWKKGIPEQIKKQSAFSSVVLFPETHDAPRDMLNADYLDYILRVGVS